MFALLFAMLGVIGVSGAAPALADVQPAGGQYVPLTPARIASAVAVPATGTYTFSPLAKGGVPASGVSAVAFNLTSSSVGTGHLTVYPTATSRPSTSTLNYRANLNLANSVVVRLGTGDQVSVYNSASTPAKIYIDVLGWFGVAGSATAGSTFVPLTPARIASAVAVTAGGSVAIAPLGLGGIPSANVSAIVAHVTASSATAGSLTIYPDGVTRPGTSTVNYRDDPSYTNQVPITLGTNGKFQVYSNQAATVTVDIVGYYQTRAGTAAGSSFEGLVPARAFNAVSIAGGATASYRLAGASGVPASGVSAVAFNLTATAATTTGALTVFAADTARPATRLLSYRVGGSWATLQTGRLSADGRVSIYNSGTAAITLYLDVLGYYRSSVAPGAPTGVSAVAENAAATVTWSAPADGGASITKYTVTASPGGASTVVTGATSIRLTGLTNGTAYTFTVTATNAVGTSAASPATAAVTPAPPAPPGRPFVTDVMARDGAVAVTWSPPPAGAGTVSSYLIKATPGTASLVVTGGARTQAVLTGLTNGTSYRVTVAATNANGTGAASDPSRPFLPAAGRVPLRPAVTAVIALNQRVDLQWVAPPDGGTDITGYRVTVDPGARVVTVAAGTTVTSVTGLTNGTAHTFTVAAVNAAGTGPAETVTATPLASRVPTPPIDIQVAVPASGQLTATWTAPTDVGTSPVTGYTVTATPGGATVTTGATTTTATLSGLITTTAYALTVRAVSAAGTGVASAASPAALPLFNGKSAPVVLSAASVATLRAVKDTGALEFVQPPAQVTGLTVGTLVVMGPNAQAPGGYYGRVTGVGTASGVLIVNTVAAGLDEAVTDGALSMQGTLTTADVESFTPLVPGVRLVEPTIGGRTAAAGARAVAPGTVAAADAPAVGLRDGALVVEWQTEPATDNRGQTSSLELQLELTPGFTHTQKVSRSGVQSTLNLRGDVELQALGKLGYVRSWESKEHELGRINGRCVTRLVGWLPVVVCPRFIITGTETIDAGGGAALSLSYARQFTSTVTFDNGVVTAAASSSRVTSGLAPTASLYGETTVESAVSGTFGLYLYGAVGPTVSVTPYVEMFADTTQDPWWEVRAGMRIRAALKSDHFFGKKVNYESGDLVNVFDTIMMASGPFAGLKITPDDPRTAIGSTLDLNVAVVGYPANIPITWSVTGPATIDANGVLTPTGQGSAAVTAESPAIAGGRPLVSATASVLIGAGVPSSPFRVTAGAVPYGAEVAWEPPVSDRGSAVLRYVVTTSPPSTSVEVSAATRTTTIGGLLKGIGYQIQVRAINAIGASLPGIPAGFVYASDDSFLTFDGTATDIMAGDPNSGDKLSQWVVPSLSQTGRYVVFSLAQNSPLAPVDLVGASPGQYLVRRDLITGKTVLVSRAVDGVTPVPVPNTFVYRQDQSVDGSGSVIVYQPVGASGDLLVNNLAAHTVVNVTTGRLPGAEHHWKLSADGTTIAILDAEPDPVYGRRGSIYRLQIGSRAIAKISKCGVVYTCINGGAIASTLSISGDGRLVLFTEEGNPDDPNEPVYLSVTNFIYDASTGTTKQHYAYNAYTEQYTVVAVTAISADASTIGGYISNIDHDFDAFGTFVKRSRTAPMAKADIIRADKSIFPSNVLQLSDDGRTALLAVKSSDQVSVWSGGAFTEVPGVRVGTATISGDGRVLVALHREQAGVWVQRLS